MATNKYPRGSEWRKWDLHVHTPASGLANGFNGDWDNYVKTLFTLALERGVAVIGITDYFTIEGYEKLINDYIRKDDKLLELFGTQEIVDRVKSILLLPNIEFRLDKMVNSNRVNYHIIFSNDVTISDIKENFLEEIKFVYESEPFEEDNTRKLTHNNLEELGRKIRTEQQGFEGSDFEVGCKTAIVQDAQIRKILSSKPDKFKSKYVIAIPVDEDLSKVSWNSQGHQFRKTLYQQCNIFFSSNPSTIDFGLGGKHSSKEEYLKEFKSFKPCVIGSDAHSLDALQSKFGRQWITDDDSSKITWIKADPTFEGLKQILYEPESRVRIQEDNPEFEREKCPFTSIYIPNETKVFSDDDDIKFASTNLPLNNSLVSIIGGRGTGKSQLINYLASAFNRNNNPGKYNLCSDITIGRKASLTEESKEFKVSDEPNAPFMYIAQSQIKELVENKEKLSRNVLETIGVSDEYKKTTDYSQGIDESINEYDRIVKVLNVDGKSLEERKEDIQKEIKRYSDFIQNITSEQNKKKLEDYKTKVERLHIIENWQIKVKDQYEKNEAFITELNESIKIWNEKLGASVPLADIQATQKYIIEVLLPKLATLHQETKSSIENTKNEFKEYKGDLSALLSNVSLYQTKVSELNKEKETVEQEGVRYNTIATESFKKHGEAIKKSIENYTSLIKKTWKSFKGETEATESYKKELLDVILKDGMEVEATITFDKDKMYDLLLNGLDGRSFSLEKLQQILSIATIDDFYNFVCQTGTINAFSSVIREDLRRRILIVFFKEYTKFISIGVKVTLNNKPITKLSYGQQGTIYLRLQLAANLFSETIIYDQPEDDLDNEFISDELISIFKTLKKYRQIIIVSHNANLVVNSDSEQVIVAKNTDGLLSYSSGALEDPFINSEVCRVLEGGKKAFEDRERKYRLS